jgi:hypothetical protein
MGVVSLVVYLMHKCVELILLSSHQPSGAECYCRFQAHSWLDIKSRVRIYHLQMSESH